MSRCIAYTLEELEGDSIVTVDEITSEDVNEILARQGQWDQNEIPKLLTESQKLMMGTLADLDRALNGRCSRHG